MDGERLADGIGHFRDDGRAIKSPMQSRRGWLDDYLYFYSVG